MSNQTNELKNMMASFFQMNTASTSVLGLLPRNTIANPKGELNGITTQSGLVLDGPSVPMPPPFINPEEDERVKKTLTNSKLSEFTIKVPPLFIHKTKPPSQRNYVVHQRDSLHPNIPYPLRMHKRKQQDKDEIQIHKFWQMFKQLHINITLADALILILKYQKMLIALISNKEKLLELANTPLNENCSALILKKLPEKLRDPRRFLIPCGFSELKCKALANLGASINLMPLSVQKKLGLPELISARMTLELANHAICTPARIAKDVFVPVGKFTFPVNFVIVDYESDPRVPLILGRPFLRTARALIDVHEEEMILHDGDERLTLNMRHDTSNYSNQPQKESINMINIYHDSCEDYLEDLFTTNHQSSNPIFSSHTNLTSPEVKDDIFDPEGDNGEKIKESKLLIDELDLPRSSDFLPSPKYDSFLFEDFSKVDVLPSTNNEDKVFNPGILIHKNLSEDTVQATPNKNVEKIAISNASLILEDFDPPLYELPFYKEVFGFETLLLFSSKNEEKVFKPGILTSKGVHTSLLPELSHRGPKTFKFLFEDFSKLDALPLTNNEDKVFNSGILIQENLFGVTIQVTPNKNVKKISSSNASLILKDFDPPLYELPFHKEVPWSKTLLSFSFENEEKVFKPKILTFKGVHTSLFLELSHRGPEAFRIIKNFESPMEIFPCSYGEDICILDVPCLHFYPP
nr:reverse transcriptase domain-containing protein [Tanacetum cinerariifolium]